VDFVRKSVSSIGQVAIRLEAAAQKCVEALLELVKLRVSYVVQEAVVVIKARPSCSHKRSMQLIMHASALRTCERHCANVYFPHLACAPAQSCLSAELNVCCGAGCMQSCVQAWPHAYTSVAACIHERGRSHVRGACRTSSGGTQTAMSR
jgi:hypothetical protein